MLRKLDLRIHTSLIQGTAYFCYFQTVTVYTLRIRSKSASNHGNEVEHSKVTNILGDEHFNFSNV